MTAKGVAVEQHNRTPPAAEHLYLPPPLPGSNLCQAFSSFFSLGARAKVSESHFPFSINSVNKVQFVRNEPPFQPSLFLEGLHLHRTFSGARSLPLLLPWPCFSLLPRLETVQPLGPIFLQAKFSSAAARTSEAALLLQKSAALAFEALWLWR